MREFELGKSELVGSQTTEMSQLERLAKLQQDLEQARVNKTIQKSANENSDIADLTAPLDQTPDNYVMANPNEMPIEEVAPEIEQPIINAPIAQTTPTIAQNAPVAKTAPIAQVTPTTTTTQTTKVADVKKTPTDSTPKDGEDKPKDGEDKPKDGGDKPKEESEWAVALAKHDDQAKKALEKAQWYDSLINVAAMVSKSMGREPLMASSNFAEQTAKQNEAAFKNMMEMQKASASKKRDTQIYDRMLIDTQTGAKIADIEEKAKSQDPLEKQKAELELELMRKKLKKQDPTLFDKYFAKKAIDWAGEGSNALASNIDVLSDVVMALENESKQKTFDFSRFTGRLPDILRGEDEIDMQQRIHKTVLDTLRPILGAQFTEKEGENVKKASYDPGLSAEVRAKRLKTLIDQAQVIKLAKDEKTKFFIENNSSLNGYEPSAEALEAARGISNTTYSNWVQANPTATQAQRDAKLKRIEALVYNAVR